MVTNCIAGEWHGRTKSAKLRSLSRECAPHPRRGSYNLVLKVPDWSIVVEDDIMQLNHEFNFKDFEQAMAFLNRIGDIAEAVVRYLAILTEWGEVTVTWWSHNIKGLHKIDLILAARTDEVYAA